MKGPTDRIQIIMDVSSSPFPTIGSSRQYICTYTYNILNAAMDIIDQSTIICTLHIPIPKERRGVGDVERNNCNGHRK